MDAFDFQYAPGMYSSFPAVLRIAIPAILLNAAAPTTTTVQTILLGHLDDGIQDQVAAFASVSVVANFLVFLPNFLVDGVSAKLGHSAGEHRWGKVSQDARMAMLVSAIAAAGATVTFYLSRNPLQSLMHLNSDVREYSEPYWSLRGLAIPLQLWNAGMNGVLQGYGRVSLTAVFAVGQACLEIILSTLLLAAPFSSTVHTVVSLAYATLVCNALGSLVLTVAVLVYGPIGAPNTFHLFGPMLKRTVSETVYMSATTSMPGTLSEPMLSAAQAAYSAPERASSEFEVPAAEAQYADSRPSNDYSTTSGGQRWDGSTGGRNGSNATSLSIRDLAPQLGDVYAPPPSVSWWEEFGSFVTDGLNFLVRSFLLQSTFVVAMICAARIGPATLAAHQVVARLWLLTSYIVDGFAVAGNVLGSRLGAMKANPQCLRDLRSLTSRLTTLGFGTGVVFGVAICAFSGPLIRLATEDVDTQEVLAGGVWPVLFLIQPINAGLFVFDGLLNADQAFAFVRNQMLMGTFCLFAPTLIVCMTTSRQLWGIWLAKALMNVWRLLSGAYVVHTDFLRDIGSAA